MYSTGRSGGSDAVRADSMFMTVSGDHSRKEYPEYVYYMSHAFLEAGGMVSVYEGLILGGSDRLFSLDELNTCIRRYRFAAYDMRLLVPVVHTCLEYTVCRYIQGERPGAPRMAELAAAGILENDPFRWRASSRGWLSIWWLLRRFPGIADGGHPASFLMRQLDGFEKVLNEYETLVKKSESCRDAGELTELASYIYRKVITQHFAPQHDLDPLPEWLDQDHAGDEEDEDAEKSRHKETQETPARRLVYGTGRDKKLLTDLSEDDIALIPGYVEKLFGPSYKTASEMERLESALCTGIHESRRLHFTDGIHDMGNGGAGSSGLTGADASDPPEPGTAAASFAANVEVFKENEAVINAGVRGIEAAFRNMLRILSEPEVYIADHGTLINSALWKAGRVSELRLFYKETYHSDPSIAVDLLIDASGSQQKRESMVALQSYMFSAALSRIGLPCRVMSYCTYGDHTVLRRFRDFDDPASSDMRILEYHAGSNNRDGLAVAAAGADLLKRKEERRMMLVLSDGLPNDMTAGRIKKGGPPKYVGGAAIKDTCFQLRLLRRHGIETLGIFLGDDEELENERLIFGSSFLHIRRAEDFSGSAGRRLSEMLTR